MKRPSRDTQDGSRRVGRRGLLLAGIQFGVVTTLAGNGMSKEQAVGLMRASSAVYCPQFARFMGR